MNHPYETPLIEPARLADAALPTPDTHEVRNQAADAIGFNAFDDDIALSAMLQAYAPWARDKCSKLGQQVGCARVQESARLANEHEPKLRTHDRFGHRIDWVDFHPAWHELMALAFGHEVHSLAWTTPHRNGHFARAVLSYLWNQVENGVGCPTGMAYAAAAGFAYRPEFGEWRQRTLSTQYDARRLPIGEKLGAVIGYAMTEKQGGSDLRQTQTSARFIGSTAHGQIYEVTGHKWFCSAPVADGFFTLARTRSGVSCLFVPRILPDGTSNRFHIQRLKDKCGNRSNASSEIEYRNTWAMLVGDEGRGIREILSHAHLTRLDFAAGSAGLMRLALTLAINHGRTRSAFGSAIAQLPMQENVLADLALESEAAMLGALRVARAIDGAQQDEYERLFARVATPMVKFWNCQRAPGFVYECVQAHGGNGFIMENPVARLYREAPLNSIWEGTSNMMCMDVMRAMSKDTRCRDVFLQELLAQKGKDAAYDRSVDAIDASLNCGHVSQGQARAITTRLAVLLQAAQLLQHSKPEIAELFIQSRLAQRWEHVMGTLPDATGLRSIVERAAVAGR